MQRAQESGEGRVWEGGGGRGEGRGRWSGVGLGRVGKMRKILE